MTERHRWPDNAENIRMVSLTNVRRIREIVRNASKVSKDIDVVKALMDAVEYTYLIESQLNSVGPKAEKEQAAG